MQITDEQWDRLIQAVQTPSEIWSTLVSVLLGAALAAGVGYLQRRWTRRDAQDDARKAIAADSASWAYRFSAAPQPAHTDLLLKWSEATGVLVVRLNGADPSDRVAGWFLRQMHKLQKMLADGSTATARAHVAYSVDHRLRRWAAGNESAASFGPNDDDDWEKRFSAASVTIA